MMPSISVKPLSDDLTFGARITGVDRENAKDDAVRAQINVVFEERGMIVFEGMEPSDAMQTALSDVFGPLQDHALKGLPRVDQDAMPGVVEFNFEPGQCDVFEVNGTPLSSWVNWHFDACYTNKLNRAGVLRALEITPEGGTTGFADGIQLYGAISPELRAKFEAANILYHPHMLFMNQRFGAAKDFKIIKLSEVLSNLLEQTKDAPRSVHPAIWTRGSGEKVLHVSPWQAAGIEGHEDPEGDALLEELCQEIYASMTPYIHRWKPTDMIIWDNWRFIHSVSGHPPEYTRRMHRTTIAGDYGHGRFENGYENSETAGMMG
jgi:taurine dioxygenase